MQLKLASLWARICGCHRSEDQTMEGAVRNFFLPRPTVGFFVRLGTVALLSVIVFGWVLRPCVIRGASMEPTIHRTGFTFCWRGRYLFSEPKRGDIVILRYSDKVYYLKRIVGLPGEVIAFVDGTLFINGKPHYEPYVKFVCDWNLPPRRVEPGHYYVVGDNRSMPMGNHIFGSVSRRRIEGVPTW